MDSNALDLLLLAITLASAGGTLMIVPAAHAVRLCVDFQSSDEEEVQDHFDEWLYAEAPTDPYGVPGGRRCV